jgi:hypothetical protein
MFDQPTVIVQGAGASAPFGYPLGPQLIEKIVAGLKQVPANLEFDLANHQAMGHDFLRHPYIALIEYAISHRPPLLPAHFNSGVRPWHELADVLPHKIWSKPSGCYEIVAAIDDGLFEL